MSNIFFWWKSISSLSDISNYNNYNDTDVKSIFIIIISIIIIIIIILYYIIIRFFGFFFSFIFLLFFALTFLFLFESIDEFLLNEKWAETNIETNIETTNYQKSEDNHITDGYDCTIEEILVNKCIEGEIGQKQIAIIYNILKNKYLNSNITETSVIIQTRNILFHLFTNENQKNYNNPNISSIELAECEDKLRSTFNIPKEQDLIILKTDIKSTDLTQTYIQY